LIDIRSGEIKKGALPAFRNDAEAQADDVIDRHAPA
jgi:hypothetical protein